MSDNARKAAEDWAAEFKQWLDAGNAYGSLSDAAMIGLRDQFARAILQERERATLAERERWLASDEAARESGLMLSPFDVAEAVMAERERCAQIAEREADDYWDKANLVAAIRSGKP